MIQTGHEHDSQMNVQSECEEILSSQGWRKQMDHLYGISCRNGYINEERLGLNVIYSKHYDARYPDVPFQVTINCSKPEIIAGVQTTTSNYLNYEGECVICFENIGSEKRKGLRCYEFKCNGRDFFRQFPPYPYFKNHNVVIDKKHTSQVLTRQTIKEILLMAESMPGYKVASNSDKEGTGATNLFHRHYQAGDYPYPVFSAQTLQEFDCKKYNTKVHRLNYPACSLKVQGARREDVEETVFALFNTWRTADFPNLDKNLQTASMMTTFNPEKGEFEYIFFPRNAKFLTRPVLQCIKKEFVGIFESCGYAILPSRLKQQLLELESHIRESNEIFENLTLPPHLEIFGEWLNQYYFSQKEEGEQENTSINLKLEKALKNSFVDILRDNTPIPRSNEALFESWIQQSNLI